MSNNSGIQTFGLLFHNSEVMWKPNSPFDIFNLAIFVTKYSRKKGIYQLLAVDQPGSSHQVVKMKASGTRTVILDLNDDCLREVFAFLYVDALAAVADACARFRAIAAQSAELKSAKITLSDHSPVNDYSQLRNFGALVESVVVDGANWQKRFIELVVQYCGNSVKLILNDFNITDELAFLMLPLLGRAENISFFCCRFRRVFLKNMRLWSSELRNVRFWSCKLSKRTIRQKFPQLESICFRIMNKVKNSDIEQFLEQNPQLKQFEMVFCEQLDDTIFQSIARYVPEIEELRFITKNRTNKSNTEYFGRLRELKKLAMEVTDDRSYIPSVVHKVGGANISLEVLELCRFDNCPRFIEGISRLDKLKSLKLYYVSDFTAAHLIDSCKHMKELSEIWLIGTNTRVTKDVLLQFIRNAQKLRYFKYDSRSDWESKSGNIDVTTFEKMISLVDQRQEKIPLTLHLDCHSFTADIPMEMIRAASRLVTLDIVPNGGYYIFDPLLSPLD